MLPLRDANPTRRVPIVTVLIIAANIGVFLLWEPTLTSGQHAAQKQQTFFWCNAAIPYEVTHGTNLANGGIPAQVAIDKSYGPGSGPGLQAFLLRRCPSKSWLASILAAMFIHGGWLHIGGNMLFLWVFGNNVEDRIGRLKYLLFYLLGGLAAFGLQFALDPGSAIPTLGASGAIAAVLGAYIVVYPRARVLTLFFMIFIFVREVPAALLLGAWFALQLFSGIGELGTNVNGGVAYWAHIGGFAFGAAIAFLFLRPRRPGEVFSGPPRPDTFS